MQCAHDAVLTVLLRLATDPSAGAAVAVQEMPRISWHMDSSTSPGAQHMRALAGCTQLQQMCGWAAGASTPEHGTECMTQDGMQRRQPLHPKQQLL